MEESIIMQTNKDLEVLHDLDIIAYEQLIKLQEDITRALYSSNTEEFIIPKLLFASL